jgi:hypothetical protein
MAGLGAEAVESPGFADAFGLSEKCRVIRRCRRSDSSLNSG